MKTLKVVLGLLFAVLILTSSSCEETSSNQTSDQITQLKTERSMAEMERAVGYPNIKNFTAKLWLKRIYELEDNAQLICHAYLMNEMTGEVGRYLGKCVGYGIPYSTQFSNPQKIWDAERHGGANHKFEDNGEIQVMPQPEPNGLFKPEGLSATWLIMVHPETQELTPMYVEPSIIVSPFKLK